MLEQLLDDFIVGVLELDEMVSKALFTEVEKTVGKGKKHKTIEEAVLKYCVNTSIVKVLTDLEMIHDGEKIPFEENLKRVANFYREILIPTVEDMKPDLLKRTKEFDVTLTSIEKQLKSKKYDIKKLHQEVVDFLNA